MSEKTNVRSHCSVFVAIAKRWNIYPIWFLLFCGNLSSLRFPPLLPSSWQHNCAQIATDVNRKRTTSRTYYWPVQSVYNNHKLSLVAYICTCDLSIWQKRWNFKLSELCSDWWVYKSWRILTNGWEKQWSGLVGFSMRCCRGPFLLYI